MLLLHLVIVDIVAAQREERSDLKGGKRKMSGLAARGSRRIVTVIFSRRGC